MLDQALTVLTFTAAIGSALMAGVFFAFSTFVMANVEARADLVCCGLALVARPRRNSR
jgi:uncharacterized membrane protein